MNVDILNEIRRNEFEKEANNQITDKVKNQFANEIQEWGKNMFVYEKSSFLERIKIIFKNFLDICK